MPEQECKYGSCEEPALRDSEYCIFHDPEKTGLAARGFYKLIRQEARELEGEVFEDEEGEEHRKWVFKRKIDWRGYRFPDTPSDGTQSRPSHTSPVGDFKPAGRDIHIEIEFVEDIDLRETIFEGMAGFFGVKFGGDSDFKGATFEGITSFFGAKFENKANFQNTSFERAGEFMFTTFEGNANFRLTTFEERANFMSATFERGSDFDDATFKSETNFQHVTFGKIAFFMYAKFEGEASFDYTDFIGDTEFRLAVFGGELNLLNTRFERRPRFISNLDELDMGVKYPQSSTSDSIKALEDIAIPLRQVVVTPKNGNTEKYSGRKKAIDRLEALRDSNQEISETSIYVKKFAEDQAKSEGCREQRLTYEDKGMKEEADQVFVHEMRARRETKDSQFQRFVDWFVADWTCEYGTSWQTVLWRSVEITGLSGILFWLANIVSKTLPAAEPWIGTITEPNVEQLITMTPFGVIKGLGNSLYYSVITFTTLGYGDLHPTGFLMKTLSGIESVVGALFAALIIVVFARKWMRS